MRRRGFILMAVLFALVLLLALASAGFFAAWQEVRIGRNTAAQATLRGAATSGIALALANWDPAVLQGIGVITTLPSNAPAGILASLEVRQLNGRLVLFRSSASDSAGSSQSVLLVARLTGPEIVPSAALRARAIHPLARSRADGTDRTPPGWNCPAPSGAVSAAIVQPGASDSAFFQFGPMDWAALVTWARAVPPGGDSLGVAFAAQDTTLAGGRTLGLLVVGGDLVLRGGAEVVGAVLVRGRLLFEVGGAAVYGGVVASQVIVAQGVTPQSITLQWSSCSVVRTTLSRGVPIPVPGTPLFGVF